MKFISWLITRHSTILQNVLRSHLKLEVFVDKDLTKNPVTFKIRIGVKNQHFNHRKFTYIDQAKIMLIHRELFRTNLFLQSRGIGAL